MYIIYNESLHFTGYTCGGFNSDDCIAEFNNAVTNGQLDAFYTRCEVETGATPLRDRCALCCDRYQIFFREISIEIFVYISGQGTRNQIIIFYLNIVSLYFIYSKLYRNSMNNLCGCFVALVTCTQKYMRATIIYNIHQCVLKLF